MQSQTLHETIVRDIIDFMDEIKDSDVVSHFRKVKDSDFKSISSKTEGLTLVFPIITSNNVDITTASMIAKAQERQAASMLQMLFSAVSFNNAKDGFEYINQFHTNLNYKDMNVDTFINIMDKAVGEGAVIVTDKNIYNNVINDLRNINNYFSESFSEESLNEFKITKNSYGDTVVLKEIQQAPYRRDDSIRNSYMAAPDPNDYRGGTRDPEYYRDLSSYEKNAYQRDMNNYSMDQDELNRREREVDRNQRQSNYSQDRNDRLSDQRQRQSNYNQDRQDRIADRLQRQTSDDRKFRLDQEKQLMDREENLRKGQRDRFNDQRDIVTKRLIDNDVKKANELVPTLMYVNFLQTVPDGGKPIQSQMIIGVKAKIYAVDSTELIKRIIIKNQDRNGLLRLIKATTREISFINDFLFAIDRAKLDAMSHSKKGSSSKLFKVLERRANKSKFKRRLGAQNDAAAISTIHITREEANIIKKTANIDIMQPKVIRPIMESYNLMSFVVTDESVESASFIYDSGDDFYETISYSNLERESSDNSAKKVINLMSKMSR